MADTPTHDRGAGEARPESAPSGSEAPRMAGLQAVTAALCEAALPVEVARVVANEMRAVLGADQAAIAVPSEDGAELVMLGHFALDASVPRDYPRLPVDCDLPIAQAYRDDAPVWIRSYAEFQARFPGAPPVVDERSQGGACLPIRVHGKRLGALAFVFVAPREFDASERALLDNLARNAGLALERAGLYESERRARREADAARERAAFLLDASDALASTQELRRSLERLARLAVPRIADWCVVDLRDGAPGSIAPIIHHADPERVARAEAMRRRFPSSVESVLATGRPLRVERMTDAWLAEAIGDPEHRALLRGLEMRSMLAAPIAAHGTTFGALIFATAESGRSFSAADLELADLLGRRVGIAIDNARLYEAEARARAEAERLAAEAQEATRAREDVLAVVSHDLRNPLNAIVISAARILRIESDDPRRAPRVRKSAEVIHRSAERMTRLLGDLIDFASIQAGGLSIVRVRAAAHDIVGAAVELFASTAQERELQLSTAVAEGLAPLDCDRDRAIQALSNLLGNAVKVTASGGRIVVSARLRGDDVVFCVEDTGPGIPPEDLPWIFDRYWRGRSAGYRGTGLGLAIARGIVEAHGGRIWAESAVGVGSRFFFALPATRAPAEGQCT